MSPASKTYFIALGVLVAALIATTQSSLSTQFRMLAVAPGVGAVLASLVQFYRDSRAHERALEIQAREQVFDFGVAAHMGEVAFDRHVLFCDEYLKQLVIGLDKVMSSKPSYEIASFGQELCDVRRRHLVWISSDADLVLTEFEGMLKSTGLVAHVLGSMPVGETRSRLVEQMMQGIIFLSDSSHPDDDPKRGLAVARIVGSLRTLLGIDDVTQLRRACLARALKLGGAKPL